MSSLAAQLAQNASLNASLLVDRSKRKPTVSYLFTGREADQHDLDAIHALGINSLLHLASVRPGLKKYEEILFSERARETDRTMLTKENVEELNEAIEDFLLLLGPYLMEAPATKILEWLVRRFRIHEFNLEAVLSLFLPYHESPHFAKMVTILQIKPNSTWSFLIPYKSAAQKLPRVSLVTEMLKNDEVARFVASLLPTGVKKDLIHRTLVAFYAATMHEFITRSKSLKEGTVAYILPALLEPLQRKVKLTSGDVVLGSYILFSALSKKCELSASALNIVVGAMASSAQTVNPDQFVNSLVAVCEPQPELEHLSDKTLNAILQLSKVKECFTSTMTWVGCEKVLSPLARGLSNRLNDETAVSLLEALIAMPSISLAVIEALTSTLLLISIKQDNGTETIVTARRLLSFVQQRYPAVLQRIADGLSEDEESIPLAMGQLVISLSTIPGMSSGIEDFDTITSSSSADEKIRTAAVKKLLKSLSGKELTELKELESIRGVLTARLQDDSTAVLGALYGNPSTITQVFLSDPKLYLSSLRTAMTSQPKTKRDALRLHLTFLFSHFYSSADQAIKDEVFHVLVFPLLLFSKSRQKTAELVWDIVSEQLESQSTKGSVLSEWLAGCAKLVKEAVVKNDGADSVERMNHTNFAVAGKIAENILASNRFSDYLITLLGKLQDCSVHTKLFAYLISLLLIRKASGDHQLDVAQRMLEVMDLKRLSGVNDLSQEHLSLGSAEDVSFGRYAVTKPHNAAALSWLQVYMIATIAQIAKPHGVVLDWFASAEIGSTSCGRRYVRLMRSIYRLANASTTLPVLSSAILQLLFISLQDGALAFLAGIWTAPATDDLKESIGISLLHAAAFLEAHIQEDDGIDFQTILPAVLVALQSSDAQVREGGLECISRIRILNERWLSSIYQFDVIYGQGDNTLQYLDQSDLKRYLNDLVGHRDHFANDASYLKVFHEQYLGRAKSEKKKDVDYKHRVICYILSHVNAMSSESAQVALLKSIATIADKAKSQILLPTIQALVEKASRSPAPTIFVSTSEELTTRTLSCLDATAAEHLNASTLTWDIFTQMVQTYLRPGTPLAAQQALVHGLEMGLFSALNEQNKITLCDILLELGSKDLSSMSLARNLLSNILVDVSLIIHLLDILSPVGPPSSPRVSKRAKTLEAPKDTLPRLSLLAEILGTKSLPGDLDLISRLLDTLNQVVQSLPPTQAEVSYIEQLLMSAIESAASKVIEAPNLSPSVIRLDILVEVIRVCGNPQTFHQALLLIANLARLAPESVLLNVMPVFTFMGSNVFHRDDSYSFKVVQQTIDGIVPVMVSSLKKAHSQPLDLYIASRDFLRVFTDAATHIPRHRRNNFFAHLVDVLGAHVFSAPLCMLLLEKTANRITRQSSEEIQSSLSLPISVFQHSVYAVQIHTATEILKESQRLLDHVSDPKSIGPFFLEGTIDSDHLVSFTTVMKRRLQALIIFIGFALKARVTSPGALERPTMSMVIAQLIKLATSTSSEVKTDEVSEVARLSLRRLLVSMSVVDFVDVINSMLESQDVKIQAGALELLAKRLPHASSKMRSSISAVINKILVSIKNTLTIQRDNQVTTFAFQSMKSIAATLCPGEEGPMSDLVPYVLSGIKEQELVSFALSAVASISIKLGPRIIPFFRSIVSHCIAILRGNDTVLFEDALAILHGLLTTIPTFWGSGDVTEVVFLYMDKFSFVPTPLSLALSNLTKALTKRTPSQTVLPAVFEIWTRLLTSKNLTQISAYFEVVGRTLQHAERPTVLEHLRTAFKIFLEALDIVKVDELAEIRVISAFKELVVKLNEAAFRPLFRRLHDWAFAGEIADNQRRTSFARLYINLLDFFKGLMVPYMAITLQPFSNILKEFSTLEDLSLWLAVVRTITRALNYDDGGFWRDDKLRQISSGLTGQIEVCIRLNFTEGKSELQECLGVLIENVTDDTLLKTVNLNILMHTRSEDPRVRIFALSCSTALWSSYGGKLIGFVAETATFIAECSEDENDVVVKESFRLKNAVENVVGKIDGL
ncbi:unnamed protein product [Cyclocybe aegerita]|uniref:U3 small nucleolar RNA-associated protein 10 n=1 Tax=Cyclocybe aegerita TaxID=1973307 RepID=A0A8S0VUF5_CYCAE|nr:unnamed protein product [Cyclocybe aegerita]